MTEKPILFSGPMTRAIIDGKKSQTRRVLKPQPEQNDAGLWVFPPNWTAAAFKKWTQAVQTEEAGLRQMFQSEKVKAGLPYIVGDLLWVREAHALVGNIDPSWVIYRANGYEAECARNGFDQPYPPESKVKWRPSIHMPRWASRITLKVTAVKVERLQDISQADAMAEGIEWRDNCWATYNADGTMKCGGSPDPIEAFRCLWVNINGAESWAANPWCAAYSFERVK